MLIKFARSLTPRAAGVSVLIAAGIAAALVATVGSSTSSKSSAPVHQRLSAAGAASAASGSSSSSSSSSVALGSGPIVTKAVHHDTSAPLRTIRPTAFPPTGPKLTPDADGKRTPPPSSGTKVDPVVQKQFGTGQMPSTSVNFEGVPVGQGGQWAPPDPNGAVGANNYIEIVNDGFAVYSKTGATVLTPRPTNTIFSGFGGNCQTSNDGDGTVLFDHFAQRWIIQQFNVSHLPYSDCIAVSTSSDPTGSWYRYEFQTNNTDFNDYPKLGIWSDGYYISYNIFANGNNYTGPEVCAFDKSKMLQGLAATQQCFKRSASYYSLLPADIDGPTQPPAGSPELFLSEGTNSLQEWQFHVDWNTPGNSTFSTNPIQFSVPIFTEACGGGTCIPQPGTTQKLDSLGDRLMYRLAYRNFGDHEALVVAQSVNTGGVTGMRWYELRGPWATPTVFQSGTYQPDTNYRWMGSIAQDHSGDMALGFAISSGTLSPGARYTGRLVGDAAGTMGQGESTLVSGTGSQIGGLSRWGDYTSMSVDPVDDCTFWYLGEYISTNGNWNWKTRIGAFKFPSCSSGGGSAPNVTSFLPTSGPVGTNVAISGTGFTGATGVKFNTTAATTFNVDSDTSIHATVPNGATTGPIAVTTSNGTGTSSTNFSVTAGGNPPTVSSFNPTSGPVGTDVTLTGTGFTGATTVTFNNTPSTSFTINSDTSIDAIVPSGATTGPIAVTTANGTGTSSTNFTVTASPPTVTSFNPTSGPVGTSVSITGTNFTGATAVKFNNTSATSFTVNSATNITATVPSGATTGPIAVTTSGGTGTSSTNFTVTTGGGGKPSISSFSPTSGHRGSSVTINGNNFTGATIVRLGSFSATFTVNSNTKITAVVPTSARPGVMYHWSVTTPGGSATSFGYFRVTG